MVLPNEYAGYYPEEEETIIDIAKPNDSGTMPAANYSIAGPLADYKPNTAMKDAMASAGANVAGNVGQAGLMGGGPEGTFFEKGLWGLGKGAGAPYAATGMQTMGMAPFAMGKSTAAGTAIKAAGIPGVAGGAGTMAALASNPVGWGLAALLGAKHLFGNKGGAVGPLSPQYAGEGMYTFPVGHGAGAWDGYRGPDYEDFLEDNIFSIEPEDLVVWNDPAENWNDGFKKGGNVQHKEHGGMMAGPLSNSKSVKIEKKETIEYKN